MCVWYVFVCCVLCVVCCVCVCLCVCVSSYKVPVMAVRVLLGEGHIYV